MLFKESLFEILSSCCDKVREELESQVSAHVAMRDYSDFRAYISSDIVECLDTSIIDRINKLLEDTERRGINTETHSADDGVYDGQTS